MKKAYLLIFLILILVVVSACTKLDTTGEVTKTNVVLFKSPSCGCCVGHGAELERNDFDVDLIQTENMNEIKQKYNIPSNMESCHTSIIEGYVVEGHVPVEAIEKLLDEKPDIDGISLPRMPAGSPGMPGLKTGPWIIYALNDGKTSEFMVI